MAVTAPILGLDLGSSKACVAAVDGSGVLRLLADPWGRTIIPSVVSFHPSGNVLVGAEALARLADDPDNTITRADAESGGIRNTRAGRLSPIAASHILLDHLRRMADAALQTTCESAVLTTPASASSAYRSALAEVADNARLRAEAMLDCPVAIAYAYGLEQAPPQLVAVCDLGGRKFECSIVFVENRKPAILATASDAQLGGDLIREGIVDWLAENHLHQHGVDLRAAPSVLWRLRDAAEQAKRQMSAQADYGVNVAVAGVDTSPSGKTIDLQMLLTDKILRDRARDVVERCAALCAEAMRQAGVQVGQIAQLILAGGGCRMPLVQQRLGKAFGRQGRMDVDPEAACALGAALFAAKTNVLDHRITSPYGAVSPPPPNTTQAPVLRQTTRVGRVITKKMFTAAMPAVSEEVAFSAPAAASTPTLIEATATRLGLSTVAGFCDTVIGKSQPLPASNTRVFSTAKDNQSQVQIRICEGDSRRFGENLPLGALVLDQLPPRPRGSVRIAVTFSIDTDGLLEASARDEQTGQEQRITVQLPR